jgi:hypothetical protein
VRKSYCTQNNGDCSTCSLVNYGRDCMNNPLYTCKACGIMFAVDEDIMQFFAPGNTPKVCSDECGKVLRERNRQPEDNPDWHGPVNQSEPY